MKRNLIWGTLAIAIAAIAATFVPVTQASSDKVESPSGSNLSTTITISQAYGGGGGATGTYTVDYVELKNISASPQSLSGLSLMYGSATGQFGSSATNIFALPAVSLNPGQYYLVQLSTAGMGGVPLPVPADATTTNLSMSGTNGKVALVTSAFASNTCGATATPCTLPNANIIDLVSWGTANNAEGGASTNGGASLTATQGNVRKNGGCTETDNNNADFDIITAPVPRNTATTAAPCGAVVPANANADFNGDGKTDFTVARGTNTPFAGLAFDPEFKGRRVRPEISGEAPQAPQIYWYTSNNGSGTTSVIPWGDAATDYIVPEDYDGDGKTDIAIWREAPATQAAFYILQSSNFTANVQLFGQTGDDPAIVGDYDGDGKADITVYRCPTVGSGDGQCFFFYRGTNANPGGNTTYVPWGFGENGDFFPLVGDFDGDGKNDFCIQRANPSAPAQGQFVLSKSSGGVEFIDWGLSTDFLIPGDYDGDGRSDFAVRRTVSGGRQHWILLRTGTFSMVEWGITGDSSVPGDYDGDGKTDLAIWRPNVDGTNNNFWIRNSSNLSTTVFEWGQCATVATCDFAVAGWAVH